MRSKSPVLKGDLGGSSGDLAGSSEVLVRLCGYLPLAIQVVVLLREPETTVAGLVAELGDEKSRLAKLRVLTPEGKVWVDLDVAASLSLSYRRLQLVEQRVLERVADFAGADLRYADFYQADLTNANFNGADLRYANFSGANLAGAKLNQARLARANFTGADLYQTNIAPISL
jgi:Pentapeptide repeats (8 copies)